MNAGAGPMQAKGRPRIPTPDVTKEVVDRESRLSGNAANLTNQIASGVTLMPHHLASAASSYHPGYNPGEVPFVQVVLSPIQELEGSSSVNSTLHPGQPGTAALAQAVLTPGLGPVSLPMTVSQLTTLGMQNVRNSPMLGENVNRAFGLAPDQRGGSVSKPPSPIVVTTSKITELGSEEDDEQEEEDDEEADGDDARAKSGKSSTCSSKGGSETNLSNTTASVVSKKDEDLPTEMPKTAPTSIVSVGNSDDGYRSRKVSSASHQNVPVGAPKRGEVYV